MTSRRLRELTNDDVAKIADTYHNWRNKDGEYADVVGFAKSANRADIEKRDFVLTPGRYVGTEEAQTDGEPVEAKIARLGRELIAEFETGHELEDVIRMRLGGLIE
jgi:type I restriction enzyme M protein